MKRYLYALLISLVLLLNLSVLAAANTEGESICDTPSRPTGRMDWAPDDPPEP